MTTVLTEDGQPPQWQLLADLLPAQLGDDIDDRSFDRVRTMHEGGQPRTAEGIAAIELPP